MTDPPQTPAPAKATPARPVESEATVCERCGTPMFRMHAVWRCPACGFKTDCCGW
jgi:rubrerythrin